MNILRSLRITGIIALLSGITACATASGPPSDINNACSIVQERSDWYAATRAAAKKWQAPTPHILAIIWRESQFVADAQTPRRFALGVIPWGRQSSAFGFAQAIDGTWAEYQRNQNARHAERENFKDAADFVGWYMNNTRERLGIDTRDARNHYIAYHEGHAGFRRGSWRQKSFLLRASAQVESISKTYDAQLRSCDAEYAREAAAGIAHSPVPRRAPFALKKVAGSLPVQKPDSAGAEL